MFSSFSKTNSTVAIWLIIYNDVTCDCLTGKYLKNNPRKLHGIKLLCEDDSFIEIYVAHTIRPLGAVIRFLTKPPNKIICCFAKIKINLKNGSIVGCTKSCCCLRPKFVFLFYMVSHFSWEPPNFIFYILHSENILIIDQKLKSFC